MDCWSHNIDKSKIKFFFLLFSLIYLLKAISNKKYLITIVKTDLNCDENDKLTIYNEERKEALFNYCSSKIGIKTSTKSYLLINEKYIFLRLSTLSARKISVMFNYAYFESTSTTLSTTNLFFPSTTYRIPGKGELIS